MSDLSDLNDVEGAPLNAAQVGAILNQIDLDVLNLLRDGKLAASNYVLPGPSGGSMDRAGGLMALLAARVKYEALLHSFPAWEVSQAADCCTE